MRNPDFFREQGGDAYTAVLSPNAKESITATLAGMKATAEASGYPPACPKRRAGVIEAAAVDQRRHPEPARHVQRRQPEADGECGRLVAW